tara:strand:+ start:2741 stop:6286 length:3546 start_codon:yes stop_codon:yes gene_type:complete
LIINTSSFQNYIKDNIISYVNENTKNIIKISDTKFNLKGELVVSDLLLSDENLDTILSLKSLSTKFIPLLSANQYESYLNVDGLNLSITDNDRESRQNLRVNKLNELIGIVYFDKLNLNNSNLIFINDSIEKKVIIDKSSLEDIKSFQDGIYFNITSFSGNYEDILIDNFQSEINLKNDRILVDNFNMSSKDQYVKGNLDIELNENFNFKSSRNSSLEFKINADLLNSLQKNYKVDDYVYGEINFTGSEEILTIDKFLLSNNLFRLSGSSYLRNIYSGNLIANVTINSLNVDYKNLVSNEYFDQPLDFYEFKGNLNIENKNLIFNLNQIGNSDTKILIDGFASLDEVINYQMDLKAELYENLLDTINLSKIDISASIIGSTKGIKSVNSNISLIKDNQTFDFDIDSYLSNGNLNGQINLFSENSVIKSIISGSTLENIFEIDSQIEFNDLNNQSINNFKAISNLNINLSNPKNLISYLRFKDLYFETNDNEIKIKNLNQINDIFSIDLINKNDNYDFKISLNDGLIKLNSLFGDNLIINANYKDNNDLSFNIQISELIIPNFFEINKNPISGKISSNVSINRNTENRTFELNTNVSDLLIKDYDLGELKMNIFGNTDYNSYALKLDLSKKELNLIKGEGSIIATNEKPNFDIDLIIDDLDISFIEKVGINTMSNISSLVSGEINLWGSSDNIQHNGILYLKDSKFTIPYLNIEYFLSNNSQIDLYNQNFELSNLKLFTDSNENLTSVAGKIKHNNFKNWNLDLDFKSDKLFILNKEYDSAETFYGKAYMGGEISIEGPTNQVSININGVTKNGTNITIPQSQGYSIDDFSFITFIDSNKYFDNIKESQDMPNQLTKSLDLNMNLQINNSAEVEITIDQETGSYISGKGNGDLLMEIDSDGKFNIYGDFIASEGIYNFRNLALIDKKFELKKGGTIIWDGEPLGAQMNIQATYEVPGGANPALLLDNPNFNKKIPTDVEIKLTGDLTMPDSPDFEIFFPNTSSTVTSEINYKLNDPEVRQLQAISLLTQGMFIDEVSVSIQGVTNNIYEKVSEVFSDILGGSKGPLEVGLNYLQGDKSNILDIKTEDRFGVTLSTRISDKILFNGKIGVPIGGIEETLIIGDVQIDFILNEDGSLRAKVFNKENEFRYIGDELGYTQGIGLSYQVDFQTFRSLISMIISNNN